VKGVSVRDLIADEALGVVLEVVGGARGLDREVSASRIQKSGLALAGHFHGIESTRIQILGVTEMSYLRTLGRGQCAKAVARFFEQDLCCVVVTEGASDDDDPVTNSLVLAADEAETPLLLSSDRSSRTIVSLHAVLDERVAPRERIHGVLVDVFEVGLLLLGQSGVGKSEVALELVMRGHRLVADDVVDCHHRAPGMVFGAPASLLRHHLEVRGLGILNVKDLFGVTAIRDQKRVDIVVRLIESPLEGDYDRLGLEQRHYRILGVEVPEVLIPVRAGRDIASILEIAARNELLKLAGHHPAREFFGNLESTLLGATITRGPLSSSLRSDGSDSGRPTIGGAHRGKPRRTGSVAPAPESSVGIPPFRKKGS
jgi:HPr kinase/phosphorylase